MARETRTPDSSGAAPPERGVRTWDLSAICSDDEAWRREFDALRSDVAAFVPLPDPGVLARDGRQLAALLEQVFDLDRRLHRLHTYASLKSDEDLSRAAPRAMREAVEALAADLSARTAWVEPAILAIPPSRLAELIDEESGLAPFRRYLEQLERRRPHVRGPEAEELLGQTQLIRGTGATISGLLRDAELPWQEIELSDGSRLRVDQNGFARVRVSPVREDRRRGYEAFFDALGRFAGSLGASVYATVKEHVFEARARRYASALEASLDPAEVPTRVYEMLIDEIGGATAPLQRSLVLRRRVLGLDRLAYHDLHAPFAAEVRIEPDWDEARAIVLDALHPLGGDYVDTLREALTSGWVHVDPAPTKRSGAYVNDGAYGAHPYMLLNHQDDYHSLTTLAHESGHLMHSVFSQRAQPYPTARYRIFVAEVASTVNEILLAWHLIEQARDDGTRFALHGHLLDTLRGTVFRQTLFAEFELEIHRLVESGEPLTGERLSELFLALTRRYHGADRGVVAIDDRYAVEWAYVPHFHYNFYVYQYATSFIAAMEIADRLRAGDAAARSAYRRFLERGSSAPPVELLADAGVDMTRPEPFRSTIARMEAIMDTMERLLADRA